MNSARLTLENLNDITYKKFCDFKRNGKLNLIYVNSQKPLLLRPSYFKPCIYVNIYK